MIGEEETEYTRVAADGANNEGPEDRENKPQPPPATLKYKLVKSLIVSNTFTFMVRTQLRHFDFILFEYALAMEIYRYHGHIF